MTIHPSSKSMSRLRRPMFWIWIALTVAVAAYVAFAAPFVTYFGAAEALVAVIVPPVTILLVGIGFGWLVFYVIATPRRKNGDSAADPATR